MKNLFKFGFFALAISLSVVACTSNKPAEEAVDTTAVDSIIVDSVATDSILVDTVSADSTAL
jgi:hypothetical protein